MQKITSKQVENWLGACNELEEAIYIIKDIANGDYKPETLKKDIENLE